MSSVVKEKALCVFSTPETSLLYALKDSNSHGTCSFGRLYTFIALGQSLKLLRYLTPYVMSSFTLTDVNPVLYSYRVVSFYSLVFCAVFVASSFSNRTASATSRQYFSPGLSSVTPGIAFSHQMFLDLTVEHRRVPNPPSLTVRGPNSPVFSSPVFFPSSTSSSIVPR